MMPVFYFKIPNKNSSFARQLPGSIWCFVLVSNGGELIFGTYYGTVGPG
jgi:hypothetical protein